MRHRVWLVALMVLIGGAVAWFTTPSSVVEKTNYRATTTLLAGVPTAPTGGPNLVLVASLARSSDVLTRTAEKTGSSPTDIADGLAVDVSSEAGTVTITTTDGDPDRAVLEAKTVASEIIFAFIERMQQQLTPLATAASAGIAELQAQHSQLSDRIASASPQEAQLLTTQRDSVLRELGSTYDRLQQLNAQRAGIATQLVVFEPPAATEDTDTAFGLPRTKAGRAAVGAMLGLVAGLAVAVGSERLNPKIRGRAQAELAFGLPVIAEVPRVRARRRVTTFSDPYSLIAESYRSLRTALHHVPPRVPLVGMGAERNGNKPADSHPDGDGQYAPEVVLVTSALPDDGKTTVVANLAAAFAEEDKNVAVVNADARNATIESVLISGRAARMERVSGQEASLTNIPGVRLFRNERGSTAAAVVNSERSVVRRARSQSDIVIVDTPPMLATSDAAELMRDVDATIVVARCGATTLKSGRRTAELLARLGLRVVGVVLVGVDDAPFSSSRGYRSRPSRRERWQQKRLAQWQLNATTANTNGNGRSTSEAAVPGQPSSQPARRRDRA